MSQWGPTTRLRLASAIAFTTISMVAGHASAQSPMRAGGEILSPDQIRDRSAEFVRGTGVASGTVPAARWLDPVCPRVLGLNDTGRRAAEARIRTIAAEAGVEVAPEGCDSNIVVTFAPDAGSVMREIDRLAPRRLSEVAPNRREALLTGSRPIRWWYVTGERGRDGEGSFQAPGAQGQNTPATHDGSGAGSSFGGDAPTTLRYNNSIVSTLTQRAILSASVLVDQNQVMGRRLDAVAAYAALVALAEIRVPDFVAPDSILSLFEQSGAPTRMTAQDRAFLRALYQLPLDRQATLHRNLLVRDMTLFQAGEAGEAGQPSRMR